MFVSTTVDARARLSPDLVRTSRLGSTIALAILFGSVTLVLTYAWFVPLGVDGGWYSYPGYALAMGRDPAENLTALHAIEQLPQTVRALFGYELRSFLIVPFHATWFSIAGTSILSLKIFGALQWLSLTGLAMATASTLTNRWNIAAIVGLATLSDSWVISQTMGDLRPDVPNAMAAVLCALALIRYTVTGRVAWLALALGTSVVLTLLHITSVVALTFLSTLALALVGFERKRARWRLELLLIPIAATLVFVARQPIMDAIVPTQFSMSQEVPYRDDLWSTWVSIVGMGTPGKLLFELERWLDYFLIGNAPQLVFVTLGYAALLMMWLRDRNPMARAFIAATIASAAITLIVDPSSTRGHLMPLACLAYVGAGMGFAEALCSIRARQAGAVLFTIGIAEVGLNVALAASMAQASVTNGVSNHNVLTFIEQVLEPQGHHIAIAPTFLWPYVKPSGSVVLVEPGSKLWETVDDRWPHVTKIIVDRDLMHRGWRDFSAEMERCNSFVKIASMGSREGSGFFLEAYDVAQKPCAPPGP